MSEDDPISPDDAYEIGLKIVEMADRVKRIAPAVPGAQAAWEIEIDDRKFEIIVRAKT